MKKLGGQFCILDSKWHTHCGELTQSSQELICSLFHPKPGKNGLLGDKERDNEDTTDTDKLMAGKITEAVCDQFSDWMAEPTPFNLKADIYYRVRKVQEASNVTE